MIRLCCVLSCISGRLTRRAGDRDGGTGRLEWGACTAAGICYRSAIRGNRQRLNLRVERGGEPLPAWTFAEADGLTGDALDRQVTWNGAADIVPDVVMLRFRLRGAKLFAFECV